MPNRDIIVMGASSGGIEALSKIVSLFPPDLSASVFVVQHIPAHIPSVLDQILSKKGPLPAVHPDHDGGFVPGTVYVAPPNRHLLVKPGNRTELTYGPRENRVRPSINALFRSAAAFYTSRVVAVLLTGYLDDGVSGLFAVKSCGGTAIAQDPSEAEVPDMPKAAIKNVDIDHVLSLEEIAAKIVELSKQPAGAPPEVPEEIMVEIKVSQHRMPDIDELKKIGDSTSFTCPECGGVLFRVRGEPISRYICHTGHSFTNSSYLAEQSEIIEYSLWSAVRHLQERAKVFLNMAENEEERGRKEKAGEFKVKADEIAYHVKVIRDFIVSGKAFDNKKGKSGEIPLKDAGISPLPDVSDPIM